MEYIDYFTSALNINFTQKKGNFYMEQVTDSLLSDGFQLFHYIARCQDFNIDSTITFTTYIKSFNNDSPTAILEAAIEMNNINSRQKTNNNWERTSGRNLMRKIHSELGLSIYQLQVLSSTSDHLGNIDDEKLRNIAKNCLPDGHCEELRNIIRNQGTNIL